MFNFTAQYSEDDKPLLDLLQVLHSHQSVCRSVVKRKYKFTESIKRVLLICEPASHASHSASHASHNASHASQSASHASHASHSESHASHASQAKN